MKKILYSPGFGAGWSTWSHGSPEFKRWMLTYQPIVDAVERKEKLSEDHPIIRQFEQEAKDGFGVEHVCILGADNLRIQEVSGPFRIEEYDGSESVVTADEQEWLSV